MTGCNYPQTTDSSVEKEKQERQRRIGVCTLVSTHTRVCVGESVRRALTQHIHAGPQRRLALLLPNPV